MFRKNRWWLFFAVVVFSIPTFAEFKDYQIIFDQKRFLTEDIFQILETDLNEDRSPELVMTGKNYEGRELFIYWLSTVQGYQPRLKWQSPNLFEDRSIVWVASGSFNIMGKVLLVATNTKLYFFKYENGSIYEVKQWAHNFQPLSFAAGDIDRDGYDELIITRIGDVTSKMYDCYVQVWKLSDESWKMLTYSSLLGNIRGLTVGDLDQDGKMEIVVEEGLKLDSGNIHLLTYTGDKLIETAKTASEIKGAAYSVKIKKFPGGWRLMTASIRGKINFFSFDGQRLVKDQAELSFGSELVDAEAVDLDGDLIPEICVVGYPQRFMILKQ